MVKLSVKELFAKYKVGKRDFFGANLHNANLRSADLRSADLSGANLHNANLHNANLRSANLRSANLSGADLSGADLSGADLSGANLSGADLSGAELPPFQIPQTGTLEVWKKLRLGVLAKLLIPTDAKRTSSLVGRKCRAEFAIVLEIEGDAVGTSQYDVDVKYAVGETVKPDSYDPDARVECSNGIHFFLTREEAETY